MHPHSTTELIPCACGCGTLIHAQDDHRRQVRYVLGHSHRFIPEKTADRFWSRVEKTAGCWHWLGFKNPGGYGTFFVRDRAVMAHRYAFETAYGPIPTGQCVCHSCDNRACVNPNHLFLGTKADNNADMCAKGRNKWVSCAAHPMAKLSPELVERIRQEYHPRIVPLRVIATRYGISWTQVARIVKRQSWQDS